MVPSAEEYDGMVLVDDQATVCVEQLQYLQQLVAAINYPTDSTDAAVGHLQDAQSNLRQYMQDNYADGRPDENAQDPNQDQDQENSESQNEDQSN